jgi:iduronate 2-sulfatase
VLFIAADDLRVQLGCYGDRLAVTPNLDRLAARGLRFDRAYCQQAVCNPSRASLLTGRRPDTLGIWNLTTHFREHHPDIVTLPEWFKQHGYFTRGIGKIFHNWHTKIEGDPQSWSVPATMHFARHATDLPRVDSDPLPPNRTPVIKTECRDVPDEAYFDGRIAASAIQALDELKQQQNAQPFFLALGVWKPHLPFNPPQRYWDLYDPEKISLPASPMPPRGVPAIALHNSRELMVDAANKLTPEQVRVLRHGYYAGISYLDAQVGKLLAALDRLELADNTIVVFWSDHGYHLGEHGLWCKTSNFELDARVPLVIAPPKYAHGGQGTSSLVELLDLYPTLVDLCGLPPIDGHEGMSLKAVLDNPQHEIKSAALTQHPRPNYYKDEPEAMGYSLRTPRYRYTEWRDWTSGRVVARELYDHQTDADETVNLADGADAKLIDQLAAQLAELSPPTPASARPNR